MNDCVYTAWRDYVRYLGFKTGPLDRARFYYWRYQIDGTRPGQRTQLLCVPQLIGWLSLSKRAAIYRLELEVYTEQDFEYDPYVQNLIDTGRVYRGISPGHSGMFFSLETKHAYFSPKYNGVDWLCMAIRIARR